MNNILTTLAIDFGVLDKAKKAAKDRDTSLVHWRFMADALRNLPEPECDVRKSDNRSIIEVMDLMAAGQKPPMFHEQKNSFAAVTAGRGGWAFAWGWLKASSFSAAWGIDSCVQPSEFDTWVRLVRGQSKALLRMIAECPMEGENQ